MTVPGRAIAGVVALGLVALGLWELGAGLWIEAKAGLAQVLLARAWDRTRAGATQVKPWPWADSWPIARIEVARLGFSAVVLDGASGEALAFAPAHLSATPLPGAPGTSVIAGHRDTHFRMLFDLVIGDEVAVEDAAGGRRMFRVVATDVVKAEAPGIDIMAPGRRLALTTCWPRDALRPGGGDRLLVVAEAVD